MAIKRIPVKAPTKRVGGGIRDVSSKGRGWHGERARHSAAARGVSDVGKPPEGFWQYVSFVREKFPLIKADVIGQIQGIVPDVRVVDVILTGSYARGTPTRTSDIDIFVTYTGPVNDNDMEDRLAGKIHGFGQIFDVMAYRKNR